MVQPEPVQVSLTRFHPECLNQVLSGSCAADPEVKLQPVSVFGAPVFKSQHILILVKLFQTPGDMAVVESHQLVTEP